MDGIIEVGGGNRPLELSIRPTVQHYDHHLALRTRVSGARRALRLWPPRCARREFDLRRRGDLHRVGGRRAKPAPGLGGTTRLLSTYIR